MDRPPVPIKVMSPAAKKFSIVNVPTLVMLPVKNKSATVVVKSKFTPLTVPTV